uniref:Uncharacterized protein n=1 Tax=Picea sitchensis TaxID=3332 RepID=A9NP09_PICSI|nr:unknown [Picea sitchensis]
MLDKIWDDTLGGPQPDSGLGRLRMNSSFNSTHGSAAAGKLQVGSLDVHEMSSKEGSDGNRVTGKPQKFNFQRSLSMEGSSSASPPASPTVASSSSASSTPRYRENVWRSVFHPGSNINTKTIGSQKFDKAEPQSPTVYDWLYSGETRSKWR